MRGRSCRKVRPAAEGLRNLEEDFCRREHDWQPERETPHALSDQSTHLEEDQAQGVELSPSEGGSYAGNDAPKRVEQSIGDGMQDEAKSIRHVGRTGQPIGGEGALEVFDGVFGLAPRAVELLVDDARLRFLDGGDDKTGVCTVLEVLRLHDDTSFVRPVSRFIPEGPVETDGLGCRAGLAFGLV